MTFAEAQPQSPRNRLAQSVRPVEDRIPDARHRVA
jgi:hypothetical protein